MDEGLKKQVTKYVKANGPSVKATVKSNAGRHTVTSEHAKGRHWTSMHDNLPEAKLTAHYLSKKAERAPSAQSKVLHGFHDDNV